MFASLWRMRVSNDTLCQGLFYVDFKKRGTLLTRKLLKQGYEEDRLKFSFRKFYGRHHELVDSYENSMSQLPTDIFQSS